MANVVDIYELSPTQQGMLFHTIYAPETGIYFEQRHCLLQGDLDTTAFKQAWQQVVNRHGVLRTEFHWQETDKPLQVVYDTVELPWVEEDWQSFSQTQQADKLETFLTLDRTQGFRLDQAPLMRCGLFKLGQDTSGHPQHRFTWSYHHLLMDGWCNGVLIKEVLATYHAICRGSSLQLPPPKPYRNYIEWLQQHDKTQANAYWQQVLQGFSVPTPLGISQKSARQINQNGAPQDEHQICFSTVLSTVLQTSARRFRLTLNTLFQGAWAVILSRYSGLSDVLFGITVSGRPPELSGVESMVGLFINTVPLRSHLPHDTHLLPWLQQLQRDQRDRETYGYSALTDLQALSDVPRGTQLFESLLVFENYPTSIEAATQNSSELSLQDGQGYEQTNYPLTLVIIPGDTIQLSLRYDPNHISKAAAKRLLGHLEVVLESFVANPQQQLGQLPILPKTEQQQLAQWSQGKVADISPYCIYRQFEIQAAQTPQKTAIRFSPHATGVKAAALTYQQLNERANQLAHYLMRQGVEPGTRVGLCLHRSIDMVVGLLGILKAGGAYVPLDPSYPSERLSYIAADAQIDLLVTTSNINGAADLRQIILALDLDKKAHNISQQSTQNPYPQASLSETAYILYTSGSTGKPKGVPILHRNLTNFLSAMADAPGIRSTDTLLAVTTLAFDIAALEIFLPLVTGAQLVITPRAVVQDGQQLAAVLETYSITMMQATPATWRLLLDSGWSGNSGLKMLCGGEALELALAQQLLSRGGELWNLYGPTETTIWSGVLRVTPEILKSGAVPIGAPIANTQFYSLGQDHRQVPIGVPGELYIGGSGLSPGYWQRPELTAETFIQNPVQDTETVGRTDASIPPCPLYKTGDLVRYREDGTLDYLGRVDHQIKLRGFRIEPGDIETALVAHPGVKQTVVLLRDQQLVAYLVVTKEISSADGLISNLRRWLSQQLPAYMMPTAYVILESLPLTPNGKVDRRSLPSPQKVTSGTSTPQTPVEVLIAGIWARVLDCDQISLDDHFFDLGGHSLLATRVIAQARQILKVEVPLRSLFEQPILADFIAVIEQTQGQPLRSIPPSEQRVLSYAQQRQWLMTQLAPDSRAYTIPTAVRLTGKLSMAGLHQSLAQVVERHDTLRTHYPTVDGDAVPVVVPTTEAAAQIAIEQVDLSLLSVVDQQAEIKRLIQHQTQQNFDLAQGPLWRAQLLRLGDQEHILLFALHHIVADGWSIGILLKELTAFYQAFQTNKPADLRPLSIRYGDYAAWQKSLDLSEQISYWQQQLQGVAPLLPLPTDYPRLAEPALAGATYEFRLSQQQTDALRDFSQQNGVTLFMTLLAAFKTLLYRYSGVTDLLIGIPIANRHQTQTEDLIGLFVNTLVMRTNLSGNPRFTDLLTQVRTVALDAYHHQDLPFEQLIDRLEIPRSQSHTPLFQVMFALQNTPLESVSLDNLDWSPLSVETGTAKFDLTLEMRETNRGLVGVFEYRRDLFSADTMHRMAGHLRTLLKALPDHGQLPLSQLPMLLRQDQQQLESWRQPPSIEPVEQRCIHQLFEAQTQARPEAVAIVHSQTHLTYQTLNHRANQLAHYLQERGVAPGTRVGIWAERSPGIIVAILAILKAGGTYVPLDPTYPTERLIWMVQDTELALVLADGAAILTEVQELVSVVELDAIAPQLSTYSTTNLSSQVPASSLAYILYTSGSTGQPKGVCTPHHAVTRLVQSPNYVTLTSRDRLLQVAPLTFDASTFEIWGALLNGGQLVLPPTQAPSLEELAQTIISHQVTTLWLTSGLFNLMVDEQLDSLQCIRQLLAGGDVLSTHHLQKALAVLKHTQIINGYGPTESTTFTCCHRITADDMITSAPIGYPINHTQIYVLDADLQQVPPGLPGELYIGGAGLAHGYLNQPQLTAERFIPNPFYDVRQVGSDCFYLYKTGDQVRYRNDGALEYLGRLDQQVKVRGFRIELGEIETALTHHPDIQQALVVVYGDAADQKRLVAYLQPSHHTSAPGQTPQPVQILRQFLLTQLPDYMVPAKFIWLDALPLTSNGKVDRKALPTPQWESSNSVLPQTEVEKTLAEIWTAILSVKSVSIHDNFFDLGGDSILAMQIVSRAAQAGLVLTPKQLFQHQTIAELAMVMATDHSVNNDPPIAQELATGDVPLTPIQCWFFDQALAAPHHFNQSICLELPLDVNRTALAQALEAVYQHHEALRLRFRQDQQGWQQQYGTAAAPTIQWVFLEQLASTEQDNAVAYEAKILQKSLNLYTGSLIAVGGFDFGPSRPNQLLIVIHHLVIDGVSWRILLEDFQQAYQQAISLAESPQPTAIYLAPKSHSYQLWANHLVQVANHPETQSAYPYWRAIAQTELVPLPCESPDNKNTIQAVKRVTVQLSPSQTQLLLHRVPSVYNSQITDTLLTALTQTITQWTQQSTVLIDLENYGRFSETLNLSRTVGWFTCLYPVCLSLEPESSVGEQLKEIKAQLQAVPQQGLSYGLLHYLGQQELAITPAISFNYLGQIDLVDMDKNSGFRRVASPGDNQDAMNQRLHQLDINGWVETGQLSIEWTFNPSYQSPETIHQLAGEFIHRLDLLIEHCLSRKDSDYTPDDFNLVQIDQADLDQVLAQVSFSGEQEVSR